MQSYRPHMLTFTVAPVANWKEAEASAAQVIREYTKTPRTGPNAEPDDQVLRDAAFTLTRPEGETLWTATVEVAV